MTEGRGERRVREGRGAEMFGNNTEKEGRFLKSK
jgi:hypothetical protein